MQARIATGLEAGETLAPTAQDYGIVRTRSLCSHSKTAGLIWMPEPIAAKDLYEMTNLRLPVGGTMDLMTKRKPALMVNTKRKLTEHADPEKNVSHCPLSAFRDLTPEIRGRRAGCKT